MLLGIYWPLTSRLFAQALQASTFPFSILGHFLSERPSKITMRQHLLGRALHSRSAKRTKKAKEKKTKEY
jgi:hypothetical protein